MVRLLRSPFMRIISYLVVFGVEGATFYFARHLAVGATILWMVGMLIPLLLFAFEFPNHIMRRSWRYRKELVDDEKAVSGGVIGQHVSELRKLAKASKVERFLVHYPWRIAEVTTVILMFYVWWYLSGMPHGGIHGAAPWYYGVLTWCFTVLRAFVWWLCGLVPDWRYLTAGYLFLMLAPPVILELVTYWLEKLYVLVEDTKAHTARLLLVSGILGGDCTSIALESTVTISTHQSTLDFFLMRGTLRLHEKAGGAGDPVENIFKPYRFKRVLQRVINRMKRHE